MKECREANDIDFWIILTELFQFFNDVGLSLRLSDIQCALMLSTFPVIGNKVVHMNRIPYQEGEETDCIDVIGNRLHSDKALAVGPFLF